MPIQITVADDDVSAEVVEYVFAFLEEVDERFSTYKKSSEVSKINRGEITADDYSPQMKEVLVIAARAKHDTKGYFDVSTPLGTLDPSGVVKGWAIQKSTELLRHHDVKNFMMNAAGDIATSGVNEEGQEWSVGIRNPFAHEEIVKVLYLKGMGVATSGSSERGAHIYDPLHPSKALIEIVSVTVIAENVLEADLLATAAFAMGKEGSTFLESIPGVEGYSIDKNGIATSTSGFMFYTNL